ncbi:MAG: histidine phosphatase family protein [bacterium]
MVKIYLIRHGESIANTQGIYQGQTYNTDLSLLGYHQIQTLSAVFADKQLGAIFASPLTRTYKTAEQISLTTKIPIQIDVRLLETNHGDWEGKSKSEIESKWASILNSWNHDPGSVSFPNGESFVLLSKRVDEWFQEAIQVKANTVFVTHDNIIRMAVANLINLPSSHFWDFHLHPAGITTISIDQGIATIEKINEDSHLRYFRTNLALHAL